MLRKLTSQHRNHDGCGPGTRARRPAAPDPPGAHPHGLERTGCAWLIAPQRIPVSPATLRSRPAGRRRHGGRRSVRGDAARVRNSARLGLGSPLPASLGLVGSPQLRSQDPATSPGSGDRRGQFGSSSARSWTSWAMCTVTPAASRPSRASSGAPASMITASNRRSSATRCRPR